MIIKNKNASIDMNNIPYHIGFIMDGNGRWAKKRLLPRSAGHKMGVDALTKVVKYCKKVGVKVISVYALSTENFNRDKTEVDYILKLIEDYSKIKLNDAIKNGIRIRVMGDMKFKELPISMVEALENAIDKTKDCNEFTLNIGFAYGGRHEIVQAVNKIIKEKIESIDEIEFKKYLYTSDLPDPDLIVRASGEQRISNFMLWQLAYSEFYFPKTYWPDFNGKVVEKCIIEYQSRNRRFGNVK